MEIVLLIARLFLALVFGVAGFAKAADTSGSRRMLAQFGVPEKLAGPVGWSLPFIEILVALALLPLASAWWGAIAALSLLLAFAGGIGVNLTRGQTPDCNCFGQLHSKPVSWSVFARNLLLAGVAAVVVLQGKDAPGLSAFNWLVGLRAGEVFNLVLSLVAVGLLATGVVFLRRLLRQQATVLERIEATKRVIDEDYAEPAPLEREEAAPPVEGLPVGAPAPRFSLAAIGGEQMTLDDLLAHGNPVLLLFVSPSCFPCKTLLPFVRVWERDYDDHLTIALLSKGTLKENHERVAKYEARHLLLQNEYPVAEDYQAKWTPAAVLISREGRIASHTTYGEEAILALVNHTVTTGAGLSASKGSNGSIPQVTVGSSLFKVGEPAPRFSLPDLEGRVINTEELASAETLLLFWDPGCPFCLAMSDELRRFEENPPKGSPRLAIIASGKADDVRTKTRNLKSLILFDSDFEIAPLFGSNSTPSGVLIDGEGRIASSLAKGERNVLALAGVRKVELPIASSF
ncbi:MAG: MauE/DoxX family redox-associated membrane protein [Blastocatellia bacterium]